MQNMISTFQKNKSGVTAVEFAFVLPVFLLIVFGILEFTFIMLVYSIVENSLNKGARMGATGNAYADMYNDPNLGREDVIFKHMKQKLGSFLKNDDQLEIKTKIVGAIQQLDMTPEENPEYNGLGGSDQIIEYTAIFHWDLMTPVMSSMAGNNGKLAIQATVVVKNESF
ncbi:MAG: Flp pilus assembly protein TadG [Alphaproteobacteria bacterium]|jgi:Flp pilus assembly protein TadG